MGAPPQAIAPNLLNVYIQIAKKWSLKNSYTQRSLFKAAERVRGVLDNYFYSRGLRIMAILCFRNAIIVL
jgi:hypothetical protein